MDKTILYRAFKKHGTDKGWLHDYSEMYADVFMYVPLPKTIVEVGVKQGKSLAVWCELFPAAHVIGIDNNPDIQVVPPARSAEIILSSSLKPELVDHLGRECDIVIDDGNHNVNAQWKTFKNLFRVCTQVYVIEDIYGIADVEKLEALLAKNNVTKVKRYTSKKVNATVKLKDGTNCPPFDFFSLVIRK